MGNCIKVVFWLINLFFFLGVKKLAGLYFLAVNIRNLCTLQKIDLGNSLYTRLSAPPWHILSSSEGTLLGQAGGYH